MNNKSIWNKISVLVIFVILGALLASVIQMGILYSVGISMNEFAGNLDIDTIGVVKLKLILFSSQLCMFLIPTILFFLIFYKNNTLSILNQRPWRINLAILSILLLFCSFPLVHLSAVINSQIPLADWMIKNETHTADMLQKILRIDSFFPFVGNMLLICLLPAVSEELIFRGILQRYFVKLVRNPHLGIWMIAIFFSFVHLQFEGFLPRMILGAILGYSYYYSKNIFVPILVHFINNLLPLTLISFSDYDVSGQDVEYSTMVIISGLLSIVVCIFVLYKMNLQNQKSHA